MAIPGYQDFMLPLLKLSADGRGRSVSEFMESLAQSMGICEADREERLPSGVQTRFYNRVTWALTYLAKSLLLERPAKARFRITLRGREVLAANPTVIDSSFLEKFAEFRAFKAKKPAAENSGSDNGFTNQETPDITPDERLDLAYKELRAALADDLLEKVASASPAFFEHLVVDLLVAMGYGGSLADAAQVVGRSGDDGIDGVIKEDRLGLDTVYVQAKKWHSSVGPGEIDKFVGSLMRKKAHKGVFITSGTFTNGALRAAHEASARVVLIDGEQLAELMIDHGVGVSLAKSYIVKKLDGDYFEES